MNSETKELLSSWIGLFPESNHPLDNQRLYDLVYSCIENQTIVDSEEIYQEIKKQKNWNEKFLQDFASKYSSIISHLVNFHNYMKESKGMY